MDINTVWLESGTDKYFSKFLGEIRNIPITCSEKVYYNPNIRLILFGPIPHSTKGRDKYSSIINKLENTDGYPKIIRMTAGSGLKITKSNLKAVLKKEIYSGYLSV